MTSKLRTVPNAHNAHFFFPQLIETVDSPVNGKIRIEYYHGSYRSIVAGYWQSGEYAEGIINSALKNIEINDSQIKKILLLGLGCGSMAQVLHNRFPQARIIGVDKDKVMVNLGKKYFDLQKIKNLKVVYEDAYEYLKHTLQPNDKLCFFDMIVSDLFIGCQTPSLFDSDKFIEMIFTRLSPNGIYISNRSYIKQYQKSSDQFLQKVKDRFWYVKPIYKPPNLIITAYKA